MIDHIYLPVSDLNRSSEFYKTVLGPLGIDMPYEVGQPPIRGFAINNIPGFWLKNGELAKDLYVAFTAKSADAVRASYKAAIDAGATSIKEPSLRPNGVPTTSRQTSVTRTDTTSRLPISLGSTNKRYEPSIRSCQQRLDRNWDRLGFLATVRVPCCYRDRQPSRERPLHCLDRTTQPGAADPRTGGCSRRWGVKD